MFAGMRDVTARGAGEWATSRLVAAAGTSAAAASAVAKANTARAVVIGLGGQLPLLVVLGVAAVLVPSGRLSIGAAVGAVTYVTTALAPALRGLVHNGGGWLVQLGVLTGRIAGTAAELPPERAERPSRGGRSPSPRAECIPPCPGNPRPQLPLRSPAADIVSDLDLLIPGGDHLAIVGSSGGGKSTLALLLAAALEPTDGRVTLGGRALQDWPRADRHGPSPSSRSRPTSLPGPYRKTLSTCALRQPPKRSSRPILPLGSSLLPSASAGSTRPPAGGQLLSVENASPSHWPGRGCPPLPSWSSMRRPVTWTARRRHAAKQPSGPGAAASSLSPTVSVLAGPLVVDGRSPVMGARRR